LRLKCPEDAAENSQNLLGRSCVEHGHLLEQLVYAYSFRVIISDMYGSTRDLHYMQLSSPHEMLRDVFRW
jgi:hypothetical protein